MIHTIQLGVATDASLDFWADAAGREGYDSERGERSLRFADYDGLALRARRGRRRQPAAARRASRGPGRARDPRRRGRPRLRRRRLDADRSCSPRRSASPTSATASTACTGDERHFHWGYDEPTSAGCRARARCTTSRGHSPDDDQLAWQAARARGRRAGHRVSDRDYFHVDLLPPAAGRPVRDRHALARLRGRRGPRASRRGAAPPAQHEHLRAQLERMLTPLTNPREARPEKLSM